MGRILRHAAPVLLALACASHSPFTRPPAHLAVEDPCRFMGTLHRDSRTRIEELRMCHAISADEWLCMARALKAIDDEFTALCRSQSVDYPRVADEQRRRYVGCLAEPRAPLIDCGLLSTEEDCLASVCG